MGDPLRVHPVTDMCGGLGCGCGPAVADPGPVPAVVEPEPAEATMVVSTEHGWQIGVAPNYRRTGLVGLAVRAPNVEVTIPLAGFQVDEVCRMLAASCPIETVPGELDDRRAVTVEQVHTVLARHQVDVAWFRRRNGYAWWCGCLTDGTDTHPDSGRAWLAAAWHQAEQVAAVLAAGEPDRAEDGDQP